MQQAKAEGRSCTADNNYHESVCMCLLLCFFLVQLFTCGTDAEKTVTPSDYELVFFDLTDVHREECHSLCKVTGVHRWRVSQPVQSDRCLQVVSDTPCDD